MSDISGLSQDKDKDGCYMGAHLQNKEHWFSADCQT